MTEKKRTYTGADLARQVWSRYVYMRDNGHTDYVEMAAKCEDYFAGLQWDAADMQALKAANRPYITINKIISTVSNVMGAQIFNRTDTAVKPRNEGATAEVADALTKVMMQIGDNNLLTWVRSDVFADGVIGSRGFYDARLDFTDSLQGEVRIKQRNPKNVLIDPDADTYEPDGWADVIYTEWLSPDDIELLYGKEKADRLRNHSGTGSQDIEGDTLLDRDRFSGSDMPYSDRELEMSGDLVRSVRVVDYQWRKLDKVQHFVNIDTGDMRAVPGDWDTARIDEYVQKNPNTAMTTKLIKRIRWTVVAGDEVLHDDWSPYKYFTLVPYFPHFRRGRTIGLVQNLLGSQDLLNKTSSQELHVINTTANSGWKIRRNALKNMTLGELEMRGAQTGLVLELDELNAAEKIQPNQTPSGLDRVSYKAEEHIKSISGVSDYMTGFAREDVSAKSVKANQAGGSSNIAKIQDNLNRSDYLLGRNVIDMVQSYYTERRLVQITTDNMTNKTEPMVVNEMTPEGRIVNDLTLGEYSIVITNQPDRDTYEDSQFDQAVMLREQGVRLPDKYLIKSSRMKDKADIVTEMEGDADSEQAKAKAALDQRRAEAEVADLEASVQLKQAQAMKAQADAQKSAQPEQPPAQVQMTPADQLAIAELEFKKAEAARKNALEKYAIDTKARTDERKLDIEEAKVKQEVDMKQDEHELKQGEAVAKAGEDAYLAHMDSIPDPADRAKTPTPPKKETSDAD